MSGTAKEMRLAQLRPAFLIDPFPEGLETLLRKDLDQGQEESPIPKVR
jgi:hypothetical protein